MKLEHKKCEELSEAMYREALYRGIQTVDESETLECLETIAILSLVRKQNVI